MKREAPLESLAPDMDAFAAICRYRGLKVTPQRSEIYKQLLCSQDHPCADSLFRRVRRVFPRISFDTVHRTLQTFAEMGLARVVEGTGAPRRFDPNLKTHDHFWCRMCRRVFDLPAGKEDHFAPEHRWPDFPGYRVLSARLVMEGICPECARESDGGMDGGRELC